MADNNENPNQFNEEAVHAAQDVLSDLKDKAKQAIEANDVFMSSIMTDLIKVASPIVTRSIARLLVNDPKSEQLLPKRVSFCPRE